MPFNQNYAYASWKVSLICTYPAYPAYLISAINQSQLGRVQNALQRVHSSFAFGTLCSPMQCYVARCMQVHICLCFGCFLALWLQLHVVPCSTVLSMYTMKYHYSAAAVAAAGPSCDVATNSKLELQVTICHSTVPKS